MAAGTLTKALCKAAENNNPNSDATAAGIMGKAARNLSFPDAVELTAETIRYNAKWFTEPQLSSQLKVALDHGSSSTSGLDLQACIDLINTVSTYAAIPSEAAPLVARLLAYAYYQGSRTYKHKSIKRAAWETVKLIFQTHFRDQLTLAFLENIMPEGGVETIDIVALKLGSISILVDKLYFGKSTQDRQAVPLPILLKALRGPACGGREMQDEVLRALAKLLADDETEAEINRLALWREYVDVVERCQSEADEMVEPALDGLARIDLEPTENMRIIRIYIKSQRPLPEIWSMRLVSHYSTRSINDEDDFEELMAALERSKVHGSEFGMLVQKFLSTAAEHGNWRDFDEILEYFLDKTCSVNITEQAAAGCAEAIALCFKASLTTNRVMAQSLLSTLCKIATHGRPAAQIVALTFLLRVRATVRGVVYLKDADELGKSQPIHFKVHDFGRVYAWPSSHARGEQQVHILDIQVYVNVLLDIFLTGDWARFDFVLGLLSDQLANQDLFLQNLDFLESLRATIIKQIDNIETIVPPPEAGYSKSNVSVRLIHILTTLVGYHNHFTRQCLFETLGAFIRTAGSRDMELSIHCVHALTICCYELPDLVTSRMDAIVDKMSKMVTQKHVAVHALEFLAGLSRLPRLYRNFRPDDFKRIFAVCHSYLEYVREKDDRTGIHGKPKSISSSSAEGPDERSTHLPVYVYALAHHVIAFWYIAMKPADRASLKPYIANCLQYSPDLAPIVEDQGLVTLDMMDYIDAEALEDSSSAAVTPLGRSDGDRITERIHLVGLLLISTQTSLRTARTTIQVRRATGTMHAAIEQQPFRAVASVEGNEHDALEVIDGFQETYGRILVPSASSKLGSQNHLSWADEEITPDLIRAVEAFDRVPALDSHKAAVIYVGEGQTEEIDILANCMGSPDYVEFIHGLGESHQLEGATFNAQGLDRRTNEDGEFTIVWNSKVTELVYHITTLMPTNLADDPQCIRKKSHVGNDFVKIFFNNSGRPYDVDTIPSAFNYVNILITPSARTSFVDTRIYSNQDDTQRFYEVQLITRTEFPDISSAAHPKIVSGASLPHFVRNLALNACVFSLLWDSRSNGEYPSSWRARLDSIRRLWERHGKAKA